MGSSAYELNTRGATKDAWPPAVPWQDESGNQGLYLKQKEGTDEGRQRESSRERRREGRTTFSDSRQIVAYSLATD
jgi:hypothetical protein